MQKNELSAPVRTAFGYHIIQVLDKRQTTPPKFEYVKEQIQNQRLIFQLRQTILIKNC